MIRTILPAALLVATPFAAAAQSTGKWEVKVSPAECSLVRGVTAPAPALLAVRTVPGIDAFVVLVSGKDVPERSKDARFTAELRFDDAKPIEATAMPAGKLAAGPVLQLAPFAPTMLDSFAAARSVQASSDSGSLARFDIPRAREAVAALRQCIADQLVEWGADPSQFDPGGTPPVALKERDRWLSNSQQLSLAATSTSMGIDYLYRVTVATDGRIESCKREDAKADAQVEKLGCEPLIGQKLFTPAKNPAGVPVKGAAAFRVMLVKRGEPR
ncbi:hypothetical protein P6144_18550 [Sphingomonas sp. HITSZ_GF]|uniref:hypothetical protein n=1 Tax=Sphingomonas sp. HITSZ_GF TaxID=3037247 RepID=UPI00240CEFF3|nr:hypothetical protein [Sphingomonas sp. HITSZ_GF]MDG2535668.1 hypothetical protein [Sphingomonas sp. HITSZ_GF]